MLKRAPKKNELARALARSCSISRPTADLAWILVSRLRPISYPRYLSLLSAVTRDGVIGWVRASYFRHNAHTRHFWGYTLNFLGVGVFLALAYPSPQRDTKTS